MRWTRLIFTFTNPVLSTLSMLGMPLSPRWSMSPTGMHDPGKEVNSNIIAINRPIMPLGRTPVVLVASN